MMKIMYWFFGWLVCCMTLYVLLSIFQPSMAAEAPRALITDQRIKVVSFANDQVYPVKANTFVDTQITFAKDEFIEDIQNGDMAAWQATVPKGLPNMLFIKPTIAGSHTNMTVVTNQRTYYFALHSQKTQKTPENRDTTYAIQFIYPAVAQQKLRAQLQKAAEQRQANINRQQLPQHYDWDYSFNGDPSIMPLHVFDDGRFTYLQLRPHQVVPAIFAVTNQKGLESVVNYRRQGNYLVIQRIAPQFTLRDGKYHVASLFNNRLISQIAQR